MGDSTWARGREFIYVNTGTVDLTEN